MRNQSEQATDLLKETFGDVLITGVEIGTGDGCFSKSLLLNLPNLQMIYTIDPYTQDLTSEFEANLPIEVHKLRKQNARLSLDHYPGRYVLIEETSNNALSLIPDNVDFVWVDGDHRKEQIYKDIINYYSKVKSGGIFGGHDYHRVIPILREMIEGTIMLGDDWTWWIEKEKQCLKMQEKI